MFELNIQFIITYMVVAGGGFFVTTSAYCEDINGYNSCPSGEGFEYPFYGGSGYSSNSSVICGYPEFKIICNSNNGRPMMNVSNHLYYVLRVDTDGYPQLLTLVDVEVDEEECPRPTHNFTLQPTSPFEYWSSSYNVIYFYNCSGSGYPENAVQLLPCLDTNNTTPGLRSFALLENDYPQPDGLNWWYQNCQENVVVPLTSQNNYSDYRQTLKLGFTLNWNTPGDCSECEYSGMYSGGRCLYPNQTSGAPPLCYCNYENKLYHGRCPSPREVHTKFCQNEGLTCTRDPSHLEYRWRRLDKDVKTFDEIYHRLRRLHGSYLGEDDRVKEAHEQFESREQRAFESVLAWQAMKEDFASRHECLF